MAFFSQQSPKQQALYTKDHTQHMDTLFLDTLLNILLYKGKLLTHYVNAQLTLQSSDLEMEILGAQYVRQTLFKDRFSKLFMLDSNSWPPMLPLLSGWNCRHSSVLLEGPSSATLRGDHHSGVTSSSPFLELFCLSVILWEVFFHAYP